MTNKLLDRSRNLFARLAGRLKPTTRRAELGDYSFFKNLDSRFPIFEQAKDCYGQGANVRARALVVEHFRSRESPRFFVDANQREPTLTLFEKTYAEQTASLKNWVTTVSTNQFPIYASKVPGLSVGFRWDALEPREDGDILYPVRPHRFAFAPRMALAAVLCGHETTGLKNTVASWISHAEEDDFTRAYASNLVVIYRILALHWTLWLLGGEPRSDSDTFFLFDLIKILQCDIRFLARHAGDSVSNNHLLADGFGLWYASLQFPELGCSPRDTKRGEALFLQELSRQFYEDGAGFEHSVHYHELGCEMAVAYLLLARRNDITAPQWVQDRTMRMLEFQMALAGPSGAAPALGDSTEDTLFPLSLEDGPDAVSLSVFHQTLFPRAREHRVVEAQPAQRAFWLTAGNCAEMDTSTDRSRLFPKGGYVILPDHAMGARLIFRTGPPPGTEVFGGHMHADVLTLYLTVRHTPFVVEAGTHSYASTRDSMGTGWREFFLGRESHNGLILSGQDPFGAAKTSFRGREVPARVESATAGDGTSMLWAEGKISGENAYSGCERGVVHIVGEYWAVYDLVPRAARAQTPAVQFQLAANIEVSLDQGTSLQLACAEQSMRIHYFGVESARVFTGHIHPPIGWISHSYGTRSPAPAIRFALTQKESPAAFVLQPNRPSAAMNELVAVTLRDGVALRLEGTDFYDVLVVSRTDQSLCTNVWDIEFTGRLLWIRFRNGTPEAVRWIDGTSVRWNGGAIDALAPPLPNFLAELDATGLRSTHADDVAFRPNAS